MESLEKEGQDREREGTKINQEIEAIEIEKGGIKTTEEADLGHGKNIGVKEDTKKILIMIIPKNWGSTQSIERSPTKNAGQEAVAGRDGNQTQIQLAILLNAYFAWI